MRLLVIGSGGQLGSDLLAAAARRKGWSAVGLDLPAVDVRSVDSLAAALASHRPEAVITCAAFHEVDRCEREGEAAFAVNALGVLNLARLCADRNCEFVAISTDYVFHDSPAKQPLAETAPPDPRSVYAVSKLAGELFALHAHPRALVLRTCGLYGLTPPAGKPYNFPEIMLALARQGKPIRVVDDQVCTPTWTEPLAGQILDALDAGLSGLIHASCQGQCSWFEFARDLFALAGVRADLSPVSSADYAQAATRPLYSVLDNARLRAAGLDRMPDYREALASYLQRRGG